MTLGGELQALGMREVRERIRAVVARVAQGNPLVIMQHGDPAAVLIRFDEAERWGRVERALAALHALDVYPELVSGTGQLGAAVRGELKPTRSAIRHLDEEPREIIGPLQTVQITDLREKLATYLEEVSRGRALTVVSSGRFAASLVSPREFDRLRRLHRIASWFAAAGLDLGTVDEAAIAAFVRDYRGGTRTEAAVG
ncbi:MAG: type II toxin-antitoxin system prevent-host-death family antitoxin [Chloroflexi bacterium]|nr:type II toxin-antitoxin system prevent-host-death family antitoxin [Chloroflexota bacterium]